MGACGPQCLVKGSGRWVNYFVNLPQKSKVWRLKTAISDGNFGPNIFFKIISGNCPTFRRKKFRWMFLYFFLWIFKNKKNILRNRKKSITFFLSRNRTWPLSAFLRALKIPFHRTTSKKSKKKFWMRKIDFFKPLKTVKSNFLEKFPYDFFLLYRILIYVKKYVYSMEKIP